MYYYISFPGGSDSKASAYNAEDPGLILGSGRGPGEENGNPRQYSCLGNRMDRGAWWPTVYGRVTNSGIQLSDFHSLCWNSPVKHPIEIVPLTFPFQLIVLYKERVLQSWTEFITEVEIITLLPGPTCINVSYPISTVRQLGRDDVTWSRSEFI